MSCRPYGFLLQRVILFHNSDALVEAGQIQPIFDGSVA